MEYCMQPQGSKMRTGHESVVHLLSSAQKPGVPFLLIVPLPTNADSTGSRQWRVTHEEAIRRVTLGSNNKYPFRNHDNLFFIKQKKKT